MHIFERGDGHPQWILEQLRLGEAVVSAARGIDLPRAVQHVTTINRVANRAFARLIADRFGLGLFQEDLELGGRSGFSTEPMRGILPYAKFNGAVRLAPALVNQRLLHAALDNEQPPYSRRELAELGAYFWCKLQEIRRGGHGAGRRVA